MTKALAILKEGALAVPKELLAYKFNLSHPRLSAITVEVTIRVLTKVAR